MKQITKICLKGESPTLREITLLGMFNVKLRIYKQIY